jgi:hypothetical protein
VLQPGLRIDEVDKAANKMITSAGGYLCLVAMAISSTVFAHLCMSVSVMGSQNPTSAGILRVFQDTDRFNVQGNCCGVSLNFMCT